MYKFAVRIESSGIIASEAYTQFSAKTSSVQDQDLRVTLIRKVDVDVAVKKYNEALSSAKEYREKLERGEAVDSHLDENSLISYAADSRDLFMLAAQNIHHNAHSESGLVNYRQLVEQIVEGISAKPEFATYERDYLVALAEQQLKNELVKSGFVAPAYQIPDHALIVDYHGEVLGVRLNSGGASILSQANGDSFTNPSILAINFEPIHLVRAQRKEKMVEGGIGRHHLRVFNEAEVAGNHPQDLRQYIQDITGARTEKFAKKVSEMDQQEYEKFVESNPLIACTVESGNKLGYGLPIMF